MSGFHVRPVSFGQLCLIVFFKSRNGFQRSQRTRKYKLHYSDVLTISSTGRGQKKLTGRIIRDSDKSKKLSGSVNLHTPCRDRGTEAVGGGGWGKEGKGDWGGGRIRGGVQPARHLQVFVNNKVPI